MGNINRIFFVLTLCRCDMILPGNLSSAGRSLYTLPSIESHLPVLSGKQAWLSHLAYIEDLIKVF